MATLVRDITYMSEKACTKCGETKPLDAFSPDRRRKDGRQGRCRACDAERMRLVRPKRPTADERFDAFLIPEPNTSCLIFMGTTNNQGYGKFRADGKMVFAHRYAYARAFGPIAPGLEVHHECRNTLCCEPSHLRAVTPEEHAAIHAKEVE